MQFCGDKHRGEKYPLRPNTYFIGMQKKSALCQPCISVEELTSCNALDLTTAEHSSKQWMQILLELRARIDSRADLQRHANTEGSTVGYASAMDQTLVDAPKMIGGTVKMTFRDPSLLLSGRLRLQVPVQLITMVTYRSSHRMLPLPFVLFRGLVLSRCLQTQACMPSKL